MVKTYNQKLKSFEQYVAQKRTEKLLDKAYKDHLLQQLAVATQSQPASDNIVLQELKELKELVTPVITFFTTEKPEIKKRISSKERKRLADEEQEKMLEIKALQFLKKM